MRRSIACRTVIGPRPCGRGGFKLKGVKGIADAVGPRPCGRGGFKLLLCSTLCLMHSPRPCGRGGFKRLVEFVQPILFGPRPCGRGGFKLQGCLRSVQHPGVPARVGGVDLSHTYPLRFLTRYRPRPCGRGGFKRTSGKWMPGLLPSPPVWAGWI